LNPVGYHAVNAVIHFLSALVLWAIVRRTLRLPYFTNRFESSAGWLALSASLRWAAKTKVTRHRFEFHLPAHGVVKSCLGADRAGEGQVVRPNEKAQRKRVEIIKTSARLTACQPKSIVYYPACARNVLRARPKRHDGALATVDGFPDHHERRQSLALIA
jgi:hypothetical protein